MIHVKFKVLQSISGHFSKHGSQVCFQYSELHYQIWNIAKVLKYRTKVLKYRTKVLKMNSFSRQGKALPCLQN
jgi:hypothetical protein